MSMQKLKSNIERVGKQFETVLLFQSIVMIIAQLVLLEICVRFKSAESVYREQESIFDPDHFWKWSAFSSYCNI